MKRSDLLNTLTIISPGLDRNTTIPLYEYFCFTGDTVFTFHDDYGIVAPLKVKQAFGVHGPTFRNLIGAIRSTDMSMTVNHEGLTVIAGDSECVLPIKNPEDFLWAEPKFESITLEGEIIHGIELCLTTCSENLALENFNKVCIKSGPSSDHKVCVYATDGDAMTKYITDITVKQDVDFCLSRGFCDAMVAIAGGNGAVMKVGEEWVCVESAKYKIYGKKLDASTLDYDTKVTQSLGQQVNVDLVKIPEKSFDEILTRARVVADIETASTKLIVENGEMILQTMTPFGDVFDVMKVPHKDIEVNISAAAVQNSMKGCDHFKITENSAVFTGSKMLRLVSNLGTKSSK